METRVTVISDTHCRHDEIELPAGDLLIHCGDMFNLTDGAPHQILAMDAWFGQQKFERILCTGGNHDRPLESELAQRSQPFRNAHFLKDEFVEFRGLKIFGAPWVPDLRTHAFFQDRSRLAAAWAKVPTGIDILITHTPDHAYTAEGHPRHIQQGQVARLPLSGRRIEAHIAARSLLRACACGCRPSTGR